MLCTASDIFRLIQAYLAPCVTGTLRNPCTLSTLCNTVQLTYLQTCHIMSPGIFWTGGLFKTLWNHDQAYLEPCHRALICHIQSYSEPCVTLAYAETSHTRNPGIFRTLPYLHPNPYSEACHIKGNLQIFRTLTYLKPDTYLEPSQRFKMEILAKIVKKLQLFSQSALKGFWICQYLPISTHWLAEWPCAIYCMIHIQNPICYHKFRHIQTYSHSIQTYSVILWHSEHLYIPNCATIRILAYLKPKIYLELCQGTFWVI